MALPDTSETTVFERNRGSSIRMLLISAIFVAMGAWFLASPETFATSAFARLFERIGLSATGTILGIGLVALLFGLVAGWGWWKHRRNPTPVAVLSPDGLSIDAGTFRMTDLPWREVTGTTRLSIAGTHILGIVVADPVRILAQQSRAGRVVGRINARSYDTPVQVADSFIAEPLDELAEAVEAYRARYGA